MVASQLVGVGSGGLCPCFSLGLDGWELSTVHPVRWKETERRKSCGHGNTGLPLTQVGCSGLQLWKVDDHCFYRLRPLFYIRNMIKCCLYTLITLPNSVLKFSYIFPQGYAEWMASLFNWATDNLKFYCGLLCKILSMSKNRQEMHAFKKTVPFWCWVGRACEVCLVC